MKKNQKPRSITRADRLRAMLGSLSRSAEARGIVASGQTAKVEFNERGVIKKATPQRMMQEAMNLDGAAESVFRDLIRELAAEMLIDLGLVKPEALMMIGLSTQGGQPKVAL